MIYNVFGGTLNLALSICQMRSSTQGSAACDLGQPAFRTNQQAMKKFPK